MAMLTLKEACAPEEVRGQETLNDCPRLSQWTRGLELAAVVPGRPPMPFSRRDSKNRSQVKCLYFSRLTIYKLLMLPDTYYIFPENSKCECIGRGSKYIYISIAPMSFIKLTFIIYF